ncbi:MAG: helix-turn-helix domain-containing protein [Clostridia bacterium]|nr:helix-turn-helix domain-containing protein [Clostridia bacterium]
MLSANKDLRMFLKQKNIKNWELARMMGVSESSVYRLLRNELNPRTKEAIMKYVEDAEGAEDLRSTILDCLTEKVDEFEATKESSVGHKWNDVRSQLFTEEEIKESDCRVEQTTEKLTYSVEEFAKAFGVSIVTAYEIARREDFPKIRVGRRILIPINELNRWIEKESRKK